MVTFTENALVIKIPCTNEAPLEKLSYMQAGLIDLIAMMDHSETPGGEVANSLAHLRTLLREMMLDPVQLRKVNELADSNADLKASFN